MATTVDLTVGLNMEIGSVPVSLEADINTETNTYTFNGCVQNATITLDEFLSAIGSQFGVDVELPPELNLKAVIDYVAGQLIYTKPDSGPTSSELGVACKFDLVTPSGKTYTIQFYADTILLDTAPGKGNPYVIGGSIDTNLKFADLPLVGKIPGFNDLSLTNIGFSYSNTDPSASTDKPITFHIPNVDSGSNPLYTRQSKDAKNSKTYSVTKSGSKQNFNINKKGFSLTVGLTNSSGDTINNFALPVALPAVQQPSVPAPAPFSTKKTSSPESSVHWVDINKQFGSINLKKIGLNYSGGEATFGFTAAFSLGGFSMELQEMAITFPMPLPGQKTGDEVSFDLQGLALNYQKGDLELGGAFLKTVDKGVTSFYGEAMLKFSNFGFKALGGYIGADPASFFLYVNINAPIGGPPYLFITGLAGGFGINNSLKLPTIDQLPTYLLLPTNAPSEEVSSIDTISNVLPQLQTIFEYKAGEYWIAVGIQFTSFEMINAFALVTVSLGVDLQIGVLGSCSMTFPKGDPYPIAYIEVDLIASFTPSVGLLAVEGRLSPSSYIYGGFVKLSGGFAFYIWFSGEHAGQFVVSIGGYHPAFIKPAYYPTVPRLQMSFGLGPFQVTGQAYFALTPAMMMAGISMSAVWSSGPIKAWLDAGVDFLLAWAPFHYEASAYVNIGCSVDLGLFTLNVHVGADLAIWGPEFGGKAHVDLDVVSFTIDFGAAQQLPGPVGWNSFKSNFLPQDSVASQASNLTAMALTAAAPQPTSDNNIIKASVATGLLKTKVGGFDWIVDPTTFQIVTNSTIPANNAEWALSITANATIPTTVTSYNPTTPDYNTMPYLEKPTNGKTFSASEMWNPEVNIGPMDVNDVKSYHMVSLAKHGSADPEGFYSDYITTISVQPVLSSSGTALWGKNNPNKSPNDTPLLPETLVGFIISPVPRTPSTINDVPLLQLIFSRGSNTGFVFQQAAVNPNFTIQSSNNAQEELIIDISGDETKHLVNQNYILSSLEDAWVTSQRSNILDDLNDNGFTTYSSSDVTINEFATKKALVDWPTVRMIGSDAV
jgi:hypothetical protein